MLSFGTKKIMNFFQDGTLCDWIQLFARIGWLSSRTYDSDSVSANVQSRIYAMLYIIKINLKKWCVSFNTRIQPKIMPCHANQWLWVQLAVVELWNSHFIPSKVPEIFGYCLCKLLQQNGHHKCAKCITANTNNKQALLHILNNRSVTISWYDDISWYFLARLIIDMLLLTIVGSVLY